MVGFGDLIVGAAGGELGGEDEGRVTAHELGLGPGDGEGVELGLVVCADGAGAVEHDDEWKLLRCACWLRTQEAVGEIGTAGVREGGLLEGLAEKISVSGGKSFLRRVRDALLCGGGRQREAANCNESEQTFTIWHHPNRLYGSVCESLRGERISNRYE